MLVFLLPPSFGSDVLASAARFAIPASLPVEQHMGISSLSADHSKKCSRLLRSFSTDEPPLPSPPLPSFACDSPTYGSSHLHLAEFPSVFWGACLKIPAAMLYSCCCGCYGCSRRSCSRSFVSAPWPENSSEQRSAMQLFCITVYATGNEPMWLERGLPC